jgi:hypothetical protein
MPDLNKAIVCSNVQRCGDSRPLIGLPRESEQISDTYLGLKAARGLLERAVESLGVVLLVGELGTVRTKLLEVLAVASRVW